jgi:hypothetical protein
MNCAGLKDVSVKVEGQQSTVVSISLCVLEESSQPEDPLRVRTLVYL